MQNNTTQQRQALHSSLNLQNKNCADYDIQKQRHVLRLIKKLELVFIVENISTISLYLLLNESKGFSLNGQ